MRHFRPASFTPYVVVLPATRCGILRKLARRSGIRLLLQEGGGGGQSPEKNQISGPFDKFHFLPE